MRAHLMALVLLLAIAAPLGAQTPMPFNAEDILALVDFARGSEPVVSPRGDLLAYATTDVAEEPNIASGRPTAWLWVVPTSGGSPRRLTAPGEHGDTPVWSPDSTMLAFVRASGGGHRMAIWDAASGRTREIGPTLPRDRAGLPAGTLAPQWTPDARWLVVPVSEALPPDVEKPRVRVLRTTDRIVPGDARFTDVRRWRLVAIEVASGRDRVLTAEPIALRGFRVSPDGASVLFRAVTPETLGVFRKEDVEPRIVALSADAPPRPALPRRRAAWVTFSPDGRDLLYPDGRTLRAMPVTGAEPRTLIDDFPERTQEPIPAPRSQRVALLASRAGTGPRDPGMYSILKPVQDVVVLDLATRSRLTLTAAAREDEVSDLAWSADGRSLIFRAVDAQSYRETIFRWEPAAPAAVPLLSADEAIGNLSVPRDGATVAFTAASAVHPPEAYVVAARGGERRRLTDLNPQLARFQFVAPEVMGYYSADGEPLRALVYKPVGASAAGPAPVVTYVYEKLTPQKNGFNPQAQFHVTHGYGYLMPDVIVKVGYTGESFVKCGVPAVNALRAAGWTNGRFGINGGSFGGYAGLFLISHVDVFAAAVLRAPPSEFFSTWGDGRDRDVWTIETGQARTGGSPWQVPERYLANSPFFHADRVNTPVLILHGEKDVTVPFQQGEMMFHALRALGKPVELAIYREGDHSIVRGSRADFLDLHARTLAWWEKYLRAGTVTSQGSAK